MWKTWEKTYSFTHQTTVLLALQVQWAAVKIQRGFIKLPPQKIFFRFVVSTSAAYHGHAPLAASTPPNIRVCALDTLSFEPWKLQNRVPMLFIEK